ncbi:hypothetical protein Tco_1439916 [Tanacetum coccineum]
MKEQAYNKDKVQEQDARTQRQENLKDLASGEIVSLKILSQTRNLNGYDTRKDQMVEEPIEYEDRRDPHGAGRGLQFHQEHQMGNAEKMRMKPSSLVSY